MPENQYKFYSEASSEPLLPPSSSSFSSSSSSFSSSSSIFSINTFLSSPQNLSSQSRKSFAGRSRVAPPFSLGVMHILKQFAPRFGKRGAAWAALPIHQGIMNILERHSVFFQFPSVSFSFFQFLLVSFSFFHFMFFHVLSCSFMFFHVLSCSFMFFHVLSCSFMFFHVLSFYMFFHFLSFSFIFFYFLSFMFIFFVGCSKSDFFCASISLRFLLTVLCEKSIFGPISGGGVTRLGPLFFFFLFFFLPFLFFVSCFTSSLPLGYQ